MKNFTLKLKAFFNNKILPKVTLKRLIILVLSIILLIIILSILFKFRLKKETIVTPNYIYETGEEVLVPSSGEKIIDVVMPSSNTNNIGMKIELSSSNIIIKDYNTGIEYETLSVIDSASDTDKSYQRSPIIITYMFDGFNVGKRLDAYTYGIKQRKHKVEKISNGVRVTYYIAIHDPLANWMPQMISEETYNDLYEMTDTSGQIALSNFYQKISGSNNYKSVNTAQAIINRIYTLWYEEYELTIEELLEMNKAFGVDNVFVEMPKFYIPVEYTIENGDFVCRVVSNEIKEESLVFDDGRTLFLTEIDLLPYFNSVQNKEDAFIFIPDGSGAIIDLKNPELNYPRYSKYIYDSGALLSSNYEVLKDEEKITLPIYGIANESKGLLAIIESGAEQSKLNVRRAVSNVQLNTIYPTIIYRYSDVYQITGDISIDMYSSFLNQCDYKIRYKLYYENSNLSYMDFVRTYQEYLFGSTIKKQVETKMMIELIGAIVDKGHFVGIPYDKMISLTSYKETNLLLSEFSNINALYTYKGWSDGGVNSNLISKLKLEGSLGSKKDFKNLLKSISDNEIDFAFDLSFIHVYQNSNGYRKNRNGTRLVGDYVGTFYPYDLATLKMDEEQKFGSFSRMSPYYLSSTVNSFLKSNKYDLKTVALNDLGNEYLADFSREAISPTIFTSVAKNNIEKLQNQFRLVLNNPYSYAIEYASFIDNLPHKSSQELIFSYDIPFINLVLNGYIETSLVSTNHNNVSSSKDMLLKSIETRSGLHYTLTYKNSQLTKNSLIFSSYYNTDYHTWTKEIHEYSNEIESVFQEIGSSIIINHESISNNLKCITYDNNKKIFINYSDKEIIHGALKIPALSYLII